MTRLDSYDDLFDKMPHMGELMEQAECICAMPKQKVASIFHKGSYHTLATSYESVLKYVEDNGYEIVGAIRESYIDGVWNKEESEWLTEIQVPIRKIAKGDKNGNT